jgi:hypothetical protein
MLLATSIRVSLALSNAAPDTRAHPAACETEAAQAEEAASGAEHRASEGRKPAEALAGRAEAEARTRLGRLRIPTPQRALASSSRTTTTTACNGFH